MPLDSGHASPMSLSRREHRILRIRALALSTLVVAVLQACAAAPPPAVARAETGAALAPAPSRPSAALLAHWAFDYPDPDLFVYVDAAGLLHTHVFQGLLRTALATARSSLDAGQLRCVEAVATGAQELMLGTKTWLDGTSTLGVNRLILLRFDETKADPSACFELASARRTKVEWASRSYATQDATIVVLPGLLVMGTPSDVFQAVRRTAGSATRSPLTLEEDQFVSWHADRRWNGDAQVGRLLASGSRFRVDVEMDASEQWARGYESNLRDAKDAAAHGRPAIPGLRSAEAGFVDLVVAGSSLARRGGHVSGVFELSEPIDQQIRDLGAVVDLAFYEVRMRALVAKLGEARTTLLRLARDYKSYWERQELAPHGKPPVKKVLLSFPPVPSSIPRGELYTSTHDDWKAWAPLGFELSVPQYFQYEVRAAPGGTSVELRARGDLNGDGKGSLLQLELRLDPKDHTLHGGEQIEETDPEE